MTRRSLANGKDVLWSLCLMSAVCLVAAPGCGGEQGADSEQAALERFETQLDQGDFGQACQELEDLCNVTGFGCSAFDLFCAGADYTKEGICQKMGEACEQQNMGCGTYERHCLNDDLPPGTDPDGECCQLAGACLQAGQDCAKAIEVCTGQVVGEDGSINLEEQDPEQLIDLYYQICRPDEPPMPQPTDECCQLAGACLQGQDNAAGEDACQQALAVCRVEGMFDPANAEIDLDWVREIYQQVCGVVEPPQPQPTGECCELAGACLQGMGSADGQDSCQRAMEVCGVEEMFASSDGEFDLNQLWDLYQQVCGVVEPPQPTGECCELVANCVQGGNDDASCDQAIQVCLNQLPMDWDSSEDPAAFIAQMCGFDLQGY